MQNPTDQAESSIPTVTAREGPNLNRTFTVCRKAAKRSESWYVAPPPQNIVAPLSIPARKKPRLQEPLATPTDEAARKTASTDISVGLPLPDTPPSTTLRRSSRRVITTSSTGTHIPPPTATTLRRSRRQTQLPARKKPRLEKPLTRTTAKAARKTVSPDILAGLPPSPAADNDDANADPVTDTHDVLDCSIDRMTGRNNRWTEDEDIKLKAAVQTHGGKDWAAIASMVPGRTKKQCRDRWHNVFDPRIALTAGSTGAWTKDEDLKLKAAVQTHGGKNWNKIASMVPGRTKLQCKNRWHGVLDPSIALTAGRTCKWTEDEDIKLKKAVQMHGGKNWAAITAMVPDRTFNQCNNRWRHVLDPRIALTAGSRDAWTEDEDIKLKKAVQMHGGKDWAAIASMVPGRTKKQCNKRWHDALDPNINLTAGSTGAWTEDEDLKLKAAVKIHGGKNWNKMAAMVPGRTKRQCQNRWYESRIALTAGSTGTWTEDEDLTLKAAVQTHGGKNWNKIAAMVPGRTKIQCNTRWHHALDPIIALTAGSTGAWTEDEDLKLQAAVKIHGGKNWNKIAALVPGRTTTQCRDRWRHVLKSSIALTAGRTGAWTEDEDLKLKAAVQMHGCTNWNKIAAIVLGRTKRQCRDRWKRYMDPNRSTVRRK
jgi:hypothetical protein